MLVAGSGETADTDSVSVGLRAQQDLESEKGFFETDDIVAGVSIELTELAVSRWLKSIDARYGKYAEKMMDVYETTTELLYATAEDLERAGLKFPAAHAGGSHSGS